MWVSLKPRFTRPMPAKNVAWSGVQPLSRRVGFSSCQALKTKSPLTERAVVERPSSAGAARGSSSPGLDTQRSQMLKTRLERVLRSNPKEAYRIRSRMRRRSNPKGMMLTRFDRILEERILPLPVPIRLTVFDPGCGVKGIRDSDAPCEVFDPGPASGGCQTDGHYLCIECRELDPKSQYANEPCPCWHTLVMEGVICPDCNNTGLISRLR
jgi:hypothetical protein